MFDTIKAAQAAKRQAKAKAARKQLFMDNLTAGAGNTVGQLVTTAAVSLGVAIVSGLVNTVSNNNNNKD